jgi:hypothetical protein
MHVRSSGLLNGLISLTALYKVSIGEDITKAPTPSMFDLKVCGLK